MTTPATPGMKNLAIYGVGRSGTKAVQLYLAYQLAATFGDVWINYEPYFWLDRKTFDLNYEGYYHHATAPHFTHSSKDFTAKHIRFLKRLTRHESPMVTKFIRGNGRIDAINEIIQPDLTIVVIRDLYEVLISLLKNNWDFWSIGFEYPISWNDFVEEVRQKELLDRFDWVMNRIHDRIDQNAFYWYSMNLAALRSREKNIRFLPYRRIRETEDLAQEFIPSKNRPAINEPRFSGDYIHSDFPLRSISPEHRRTSILNNLLYKAQLTNRYGILMPYRRMGSRAVINEDFQVIENLRLPQTDVHIEQKELFDFFNEDIVQKLAARRAETVVSQRPTTATHA